MKRSIICFFFFQLLINNINAQATFEITGTVPKEYEGADVQIKGSDNRDFVVISAIAKNRKFKLAGYTDKQYERVEFSVRTTGKERSIYSSFFIVPGKMQVHIDLFNYEKSISNIRYINIPFKDDEKKYFDYIRASEGKTAAAYNLWDNANKGYIKGYKVDSLQAIHTSLRHKELLTTVDFIKENPGSFISLYYFNQKLLRSTLIKPDSLLSIYSFFTPAIRATQFGKTVFEIVKRKQALLINHQMPDFAFKTTSGQQMSLSSFRDKKLVLVCFWASWCGPCIRNMPFLKEIDKQYKDKGLQLLSVSVDEDATAWIKGVSKHEMPWLQTLDNPDYVKGIPVDELYHIEFIPQYFLIDKKGNLIYQNVLLKDDEHHAVLKDILHKTLD